MKTLTWQITLNLRGWERNRRLMTKRTQRKRSKKTLKRTRV